LKSKINTSNFFAIPQESSEKKNKRITAYLTDKIIKINLILKNKLHENININSIDIELDKEKLKDENKNIQINSNLFEVMKYSIEMSKLRNIYIDTSQ